MLPQFCRDRYGEDAGRWQGLWEKVSRLSTLLDWSHNYFRLALQHRRYQDPEKDKDEYNDSSKWRGREVAGSLRCTPEIFRGLAALDWKKSHFTERDAIDLARTAADRLIIAAHARMLRAYHDWKAGEGSADEVRRYADAFTALNDAIVDVFALHTDYSLAESYERLDAVEKIRNPNFAKVLVENATCGYCASHQYEAAEYWYKPAAHEFANDIVRRVTAGDRSKLGPYESYETYRDKRLYAKPLAEMRPTLERTQTNYARVMKALADAAEIVVK